MNARRFFAVAILMLLVGLSSAYAGACIAVRYTRRMGDDEIQNAIIVAFGLIGAASALAIFEFLVPKRK